MAIRRFKKHSKIEFDTITETELKDRVDGYRKKYHKNMTDFNGMAIMGRITDVFVAFAIKYLRKWINFLVNELFISTASTYEAVTMNAKDMGKVAAQEKPARALLHFVKAKDEPEGFEILRSQFKFYSEACKDPFELEEESISFPAGAPLGYVLSAWVKQGTTVENERLGYSTGQSLQRFQTLRAFVIEDSMVLRVSVDYDETEAMLLGVTEEAWETFQKWTETKNLLLAGPGDRKYEIDRYTQEGSAVVLLGTGDETDGHGLIPDEGAEIQGTYRILLGGENGNVAKDTITRVSPSNSFFTVTNPSAATGWKAREDLDHVRFEAPRQARISENVVKSEDYTIKGEELDGVGRIYTVRAGLSEGVISVYVLDTDGEPATADLLAYVRSNLDAINVGDEGIYCIKGLFEALAPVVTIYLYDGEDEAEKIAEVTAALNTGFGPLAKDDSLNYRTTPGMIVYPDDFDRILFGGSSPISGVRRISVNLGADSVPLDVNKLPKLSGMVVQVGS